jgi:hypothetical protein
VSSPLDFHRQGLTAIAPWAEVSRLWRGDQEARRNATPHNNRFHRVYSLTNIINPSSSATELPSGVPVFPIVANEKAGCLLV